MKTKIVQNEEKTRRAVVHGRKVRFFHRKPSKGTYRSPLPVWHECYADHGQAVEAANLWAMHGQLMKPQRVMPAPMQPSRNLAEQATV